MSFRSSSASTSESNEARTSKEGKRSSFLFGGAGAGGGNALSAAALANSRQLPGQVTSTPKSAANAAPSTPTKKEQAAAATAGLAAYQIPSLPLLRDRNGADTQEAASSEKIAKSLPDGLNPQIRKHASGYAWLVRSYLRKELLDSNNGSSTSALDGAAEISVEWRKKRRRTAASRNNRRDASRDTHAQQPAVAIQDRAASRTPLRPLGAHGLPQSRRSSVQFDSDSAKVVDATLASKTRSPPRLDTVNVPKTHVQRPSNGTVTPISPTRATQSFDLPRGSSLPLPGQARSTDPPPSSQQPVEATSPPVAGATSPGAASALLGYGAQLGRAASLLAPNFLSRHRTAPSTSTQAPDEGNIATSVSTELENEPEEKQVLDEREAALKALEGGSRATSPAPSSMLAPMESNSSLEHLDQESVRRSHEERVPKRRSTVQEKRSSRASHDRSRQSIDVQRRTRQESADDDGEESEPEDSERPWM